MAVIALNWELGADLGHIGRFLPVALALRAHGHRPVMILRDISRAEEILGVHDLEYVQAPVWLTQVQGLPPDINFTETLFRFGFLNPEGLTAIIKAWRALWQLIRPDLMVFDHAPSALLAARGLDIPRLVMGNSFAIPPRVCPLPRYRWWQDGRGELARLAETDQRATRNANHALVAIGAPPIENVAGLYEAEATMICGRPALDVYGVRDDIAYIGPINNVGSGIEPKWPPGDAPRVFAYLKSSYSHFEPTLKAMADNKMGRYIVFAPGVPSALLNRYKMPHVTISTAPYRMLDVVRECDAAICHAGGVTDIVLEAGKPLLLLPMQMEQTMTSFRVKELAAGLVLPVDGNPNEVKKLLKRLVSDCSYREAAAEYAINLIPAPNQEESIAHLVSGCESLLKTV